MDRQKIQKLIDDEKAGFDFARMLLTTIAWWTVLLFIASALYARGAASSAWLALPGWLVGALFGCFLAFRLNLLTERISTELVTGASGLPVWLRWPFLVVVSLMPPACAWLIVWALMFARVSQ